MLYVEASRGLCPGRSSPRLGRRQGGPFWEGRSCTASTFELRAITTLEPLERWPPRYRRRGGRRDNWYERMIPRGFGKRTCRLARRSGGGQLSTRCDGAASSYLGIATPNQRRIRLTVQSIASMLASFNMGYGVEEAKLDLVRMPGL